MPTKLKKIIKTTFKYLDLGMKWWFKMWDKFMFFLNDNDWNSNRVWKHFNKDQYMRDLLKRVKENDEIRLSRMEVLKRQELEKLKKQSEENEKRNRKKEE